MRLSRRAGSPTKEESQHFSHSKKAILAIFGRGRPIFLKWEGEGKRKIFKKEGGTSSRHSKPLMGPLYYHCNPLPSSLPPLPLSTYSRDAIAGPIVTICCHPMFNYLIAAIDYLSSFFHCYHFDHCAHHHSFWPSNLHMDGQDLISWNWILA